MNSSTQSCAICLQDFSENKNKVSLGCSHIFHYSCIFQWNLQPGIQTNHKSCPVCRDSIEIKDVITNFTNNIRSSARYDADSWGPPPSTYEDHGRIEQSSVGEVTSIDQGLELRCRDCDSCLKDCSICSFKICSCEYEFNDHRWLTRQFYCPPNPFSDINSDNADNADNADTHSCARCFENRDGIVLDFIMNIQSDEDVFTHPKVREFYDMFYKDTSTGYRLDTDVIYYRYPIYTFNEFTDYISDLFIGEIETINS